jgi:Zn-dependent peptidase ImmA (M78 family)
VNRTAYYEELKALARAKRQEHGIAGPRVLRSDFKRIFKEEGITFDYWDRPLKAIRGAYLCDDLGPTIMVRKNLPDDPCVFTMAHEYKHHLRDRDQGLVHCRNDPSTVVIEIGAEVFAAEFLFPEGIFREQMEARSIASAACTQEHLVMLKNETKTTMSYAGLRKTAIRLGYATQAMPDNGWRQLEDSLGFAAFRRRY